MSVLPEIEAARLLNCMGEVLLLDNEFVYVCERVGSVGCYFDSVLENDKQLHARSVISMWQACVITFTGNPKVKVGFCFVTKKSGKLRLIVGAHRTKSCLPPSTANRVG